MKNGFSLLPPPQYGLIGHRGAAGIAPENTLCGFTRASELGLNWVEFDVRICGSGEWIVIHDATLERTTNGYGSVARTAYSLLKTLDAGSWFHPHFKNERIPLLSETLEHLARLKMHPNIEIKPFTGDKKQTMKNFLEIVCTAWPKSLPPPLVSSFDVALLKILRSLARDFPLGYLVTQVKPKHLETMRQFNFNSLHTQANAMLLRSNTQQKIPLLNVMAPLSCADLIASEIPILVYTVNDTDSIQKLLEAGVMAVYSDLTNYIESSKVTDYGK